MSKLFTVNWLDVKSALVSGLLMATLTVSIEIIGAGNIYTLDWRMILNFAVIAFLTSVVSFTKSLLTTDKGMIAGVKIK